MASYAPTVRSAGPGKAPPRPDFSRSPQAAPPPENPQAARRPRHAAPPAEPWNPPFAPLPSRSPRRGLRFQKGRAAFQCSRCNHNDIPIQRPGRFKIFTSGRNPEGALGPAPQGRHPRRSRRRWRRRGAPRGLPSRLCPSDFGFFPPAPCLRARRSRARVGVSARRLLRGPCCF